MDLGAGIIPVDMAAPVTVDATVDQDDDGYTTSQGDCDDHNPYVNPGAFDIPGNGVDDDCNGVVDDVPAPCDSKMDKADPTNIAGAIELCAPWLISAVMASNANPDAYAIRTRFGSAQEPRAGQSFVQLSTGVAADESDPNFVGVLPGTEFGTMQPGPGGTDRDQVTLTLTIKVPTNANSFSYDLNFYTSEFPPSTSRTDFDQFMALLDSKKFPGVHESITFDPNGDPLSPNRGFFHSCVGASGDPCGGTGYEMYGSTGWLTTTSPVKPGETITLVFEIFDRGDYYDDSAVLLDNFLWSATAAAAAGTGKDQ